MALAHITINTWEETAADRTDWCTAVKTGTNLDEATLKTKWVERRARRKAKGRAQQKRVSLRVLLFVVTLFFIYLFYALVSILPMENLQKETIQVSQDIEEETLACVFPHVEPLDPAIAHLFQVSEKLLECKGFMPDITFVDVHILSINVSMTQKLFPFENISCSYQEMFMNPRRDRLLLGQWSANFTRNVDLPEDAEFIRVQCTSNESTVVSKTYYSLVPDREEVAELCRTLLRKRLIDVSPKETLKVIMIGIDGVSRNQFIRSMARTHSLLMTNFSTFDLTMYTQVGKNTFPNYLALFGGITEENLSLWWNYSSHSDTLDLIWKEYNGAGYRTLYTEDWPTIGGFHYLKRGFLVKPTTFFSRPLCLALEQDADIWKSGEHCVGGQPELRFHLNYVNRFLDAFPNDPIFATAFFTKLTHGDMSNVEIFDEHLHDFYTQWASKGHLNKSLLITFSDHGPRYGAIRDTFNGMVESRAPFSFLTFPHWFLEKYPEVALNLKYNTARLTSHADTYKTLIDLLYFKSAVPLPTSVSKHGRSLFNEIPKNRTCEEIPIPPEFCLCGQVGMTSLKTSSRRSQTLARHVLSEINAKTDRHICSDLQLDKVLQVAIINLPDNLRNETQKKNIFKVKVRTSPGLAIFEATVFTTDDPSVGDLPFEGIITVGKNIDRLNEYHAQAFCSNNPNQRPYCYCYDLT